MREKCCRRGFVAWVLCRRGFDPGGGVVARYRLYLYVLRADAKCCVCRLVIKPNCLVLHVNRAGIASLPDTQLRKNGRFIDNFSVTETDQKTYHNNI